MIGLRAQRKPMEFLDDRLFQGFGEGVLTLRRYEPCDEAFIELREDFATAFAVSGFSLPAGLRWTLTGEGDRPLAIGGLEPLSPGGHVWGAWGLAGELNPRAWAFVRRAARQVLAFAERELGARLVMAMANDTREAVALLERLGFHATRPPTPGPDGALYVPMERSF